MFTTSIKTDRNHYQNIIKALKNLSLPVERVKTEDIPTLMKLMSWGLPDERIILKNLCVVLRQRKQLDFLYSKN